MNIIVSREFSNTRSTVKLIGENLVNLLFITFFMFVDLLILAKIIIFVCMKKHYNSFARILKYTKHG